MEGLCRTSSGVSIGLTSTANATTVSSVTGSRGRSPPPSGRAEFTKPVAVVSGSRIDDVDKKLAQSSGSSSVSGYVSKLFGLIENMTSCETLPYCIDNY